MKCLFLAAGYATRLYPLTENFPKPLLEVKGKTILDWLLDDIDTSNLVDEYIVVSNHRFAKFFEEWAKSKKQKVTVVDDNTETNETRLGAVKDIDFAIKNAKIDDDLLVFAGDNLLDFSLLEFIKYTQQKKTSCVFRYYEKETATLKKRSTLIFDEFDLISEMIEKPETPTSNWCCPPFYYFTKKDIKRINEAIDDGCQIDAPGSFVSWLVKKAPVHAMEMPGSRYDIGTLENYNYIKETYMGVK